MKKVFAASLMMSAVLMLSACMAVPMSTTAKLARLSPLEAKPEEIKVGMIVPQDLQMGAGSVHLAVFYGAGAQEKVEEKYDLEITPGNATDPQLKTMVTGGQKIYILQLSAADAARLRMVQNSILKAKAAGKHGKAGFSIGFSGACWRGEYPKSGAPLPFTATIQTTMEGEYLPVFRNLDLRSLLKSKGVDTLPDCAARGASAER